MSWDFLKPRQLLFITSLLFFGSFFGARLQAQVNAPEFLCVQNDTLRWNIPVNTCGTFNGYRIYSSQSMTGPYTLLATITDRNQTAYFHDGAGNNTWYYYLESDLNCPGQPVFQSDTLDNRIPDPGPIRVATVENATTVRIDWTASPSPEVIGYIISRQNPLGTTILDTVYNGLTYMDTDANPGDQPETYFVVALDPCGNLSLVPDPHQTMLLSLGTLDSCTLRLPMEWSSYINWPNGVERYEILASVKTAGNSTPGPFEIAGAVDGKTNRFDFQADDARQYCFKIRAVAGLNSEVSLSNQVCIDIGAIETAQNLYINSLQVNPGEDNQLLNKGGVQVNWMLLPDVFLPEASLFRSVGGGDPEPLTTVDGNQKVYNDNEVDAFQGPVTYQLMASDFCGNELTSNTMTTVFLNGKTESGQNVLNWTPLENELIQRLNYVVYRYNSANAIQQAEAIAVYSGDVRSHVDPIDVSDPEQQSYCYFIGANYDIYIDGQLIGVSTGIPVSNSVCLSQTAQLFVPNAFVPNGVNREFKPVLQFGGSVDYLMTIYDRFGGVIFESKELTMGWDGKKNGRPLPQGMYVYLIKMKQSSGNTIEKKGTVMLLR